MMLLQCLTGVGNGLISIDNWHEQMMKWYLKFALTLLHSAKKKERVSYRSIFIINNTFSTMTLISAHRFPTKANNDTYLPQKFTLSL